MSLNLRPGMLDDLGLLPTLLWYFERFTAQTHVNVNLKHFGLDRRFGAEVETAAYRITQEALTNVARHAGVREVGVQLWVDQDKLNLQVRDKGIGFDRRSEKRSSYSSGLLGMQERAELLEGQLNVQSAPGAGTRLTAELPLKELENK